MRKPALLCVILILFSIFLEIPAFSKSSVINEIDSLLLKEQYADAIKTGESALQNKRLGREDKKEIMYMIGLAFLKTGNFERSRAYFNGILKFGGKSLKEEARAGIAHSYFYEGKYDEATAAYENSLALYPSSDMAASMYYNLGMANLKKGNEEKAKMCAEKLKKEYGSSFEAESIPESLAAGRETYYIVQLGSFKSLKNAKKLTRRLARKKYEYYIQKAKVKGHTRYRVRAGKFSNIYYAKRLVSKLKKSGFKSKIISSVE